MPDSDRKPEETDSDPERLAQLLQIELIHKRAAWQQAKVRRAGLRTLSFLFLFIVIAGALVAFFVFFSSSTLVDIRSNGPDTSPTPAFRR